MIQSITINDLNKTPIHYINNVKFFNSLKNSPIEFKKGINIIIGPNGSGKTTLLNIIYKYMLVNDLYPEFKNINSLFNLNNKFMDGVEVKADYEYNVFKFTHIAEIMKKNGETLKNKRTFINTYNEYRLSTGESLMNQFHSFLDTIFSTEVTVEFPLKQMETKSNSVNEYWKNMFNDYKQYIKKNKIETKEKQCTILLDEIDRNLDIFNIKHIYPIFSYEKDDTQIIAIIHNPLLIYKLSKLNYINFIELEKGYLDKVKKEILNCIK